MLNLCIALILGRYFFSNPSYIYIDILQSFAPDLTECDPLFLEDCKSIYKKQERKISKSSLSLLWLHSFVNGLSHKNNTKITLLIHFYLNLRDLKKDQIIHNASSTQRTVAKAVLQTHPSFLF